MMFSVKDRRFVWSCDQLTKTPYCDFCGNVCIKCVNNHIGLHTDDGQMKKTSYDKGYMHYLVDLTLVKMSAIKF